MHDGCKTWSERVAHSLAALLFYCDRIRPSLGHDKTCVTKNFLPQPTQSVGRFKVTIPYQRRILYCNYSHDNSVPFRQWGISMIHVPFFVACRRRFIPTLTTRSFRFVSAAFSEKFRRFRLSALALCTHLQSSQ